MERSFIPWQLQSITDLHLQHIPGDIHVTWSELKGVLEALVALTRLHLVNVVFEADDETCDCNMPPLHCSLPHVTHFSLFSNQQTKGMFHVVLVLQLPVLETFECHGPYLLWKMMTHPGITLLRSVHTAIFSLDVDDVGCFLPFLLPLLTDVYVLDLRRSARMYVLDTIKKQIREDTGPLCPSLHCILVSDQTTLSELEEILLHHKAEIFSSNCIVACPSPTSTLSGLGCHILHEFLALDGKLDNHTVSIGCLLRARHLE
jgi:hypothetical protein